MNSLLQCLKAQNMKESWEADQLLAPTSTKKTRQPDNYAKRTYAGVKPSFMPSVGQAFSSKPQIHSPAKTLDVSAVRRGGSRSLQRRQKPRHGRKATCHRKLSWDTILSSSTIFGREIHLSVQEWSKTFHPTEEKALSWNTHNGSLLMMNFLPWRLNFKITGAVWSYLKRRGKKHTKGSFWKVF